MPVTKSAKKALRSSLRKRQYNLYYKTKIKALLKEIKKSLSEKNIEKAKSLLPQYYKIVDKAAKENVIKKNTAARKKSRITKFINKTAQ
ncbi:30S ribosomal protein S20 [bacterium HR34]|nr:30S ribosomal protein S20 [bacterium HR34]